MLFYNRKESTSHLNRVSKEDVHKTQALKFESVVLFISVKLYDQLKHYRSNVTGFDLSFCTL